MGTWYSLHYMRVSELIEVISAPFFLQLMPLAFPLSIFLPPPPPPPSLPVLPVFSRSFSSPSSLSLPLHPPLSQSRCLSVSLSPYVSVSLSLFLALHPFTLSLNPPTFSSIPQFIQFYGIFVSATNHHFIPPSFPFHSLSAHQSLPLSIHPSSSQSSPL